MNFMTSWTKIASKILSIIWQINSFSWGNGIANRRKKMNPECKNEEATKSKQRIPLVGRMKWNDVRNEGYTNKLNKLIFYNLRFLGEFQIQRVGQNLQKLQFSASNETTEMLTLSCMPCSCWFNSQRVRILRRSKSIPNSLNWPRQPQRKWKFLFYFPCFTADRSEDNAYCYNCIFLKIYATRGTFITHLCIWHKSKSPFSKRTTVECSLLQLAAQQWSRLP